MNQPIIKVTDELKSMVGTKVGYLQINKSWVHHNNSYECAAWWEDSKIKTGIYPLILNKTSLAPNSLYLFAKLDSEVTDDYFPALWGGVPVSNKPYVCKNLGATRTIHHNVDLVDAIDRTGNSPGNDIDYYVDPKIINPIINAARHSMNDYRVLLDKYWNEYNTNGDGDYCSNLRMIAHCTENMAVLGRAIEKMRSRSNVLSGYMRDLYVKNTSWAA